MTLWIDLRTPFLVMSVDCCSSLTARSVNILNPCCATSCSIRICLAAFARPGLMTAAFIKLASAFISPCPTEAQWLCRCRLTCVIDDKSSGMRPGQKEHTAGLDDELEVSTGADTGPDALESANANLEEGAKLSHGDGSSRASK
jgi:hypothetical protein